jgi:glycerophosphoryl diester phosphodiesterase
MADGVALKGPQHPVRLKWHRLRRSRDDIDFTIARLLDGLNAGASMEVDLRRHAGPGFVCLHDETLDRETSGTGPIVQAKPELLRNLCLRDQAGIVSKQPILFFEDLVEILGSGARNGPVQLDLKESRSKLDEATIRDFVRLARYCADRLSLSGEDWEAVRALGKDVPGLALGFDPCELPEARRLKTLTDFSEFVRLALATAPDATMIYLHYPLIIASLDASFDIVGAFHDAQRTVDAWTLDTTSPDFFTCLRRLVACGVDQITTNEPIAVQRAWEAL